MSESKIFFSDHDLRHQGCGKVARFPVGDQIRKIEDLNSYLVSSYRDCKEILQSSKYGFEKGVNHSEGGKVAYQSMRENLMIFQSGRAHENSRESVRNFLGNYSMSDIDSMASESLELALGKWKQRPEAEFDLVAELIKPYTMGVL